MPEDEPNLVGWCSENQFAVGLETAACNELGLVKYYGGKGCMWSRFSPGAKCVNLPKLTRQNSREARTIRKPRPLTFYPQIP